VPPDDEADVEGLGEFLRRVEEAEAEDPDEPGRWAAFFARLSRLIPGREDPTE